MYSRAPGTPGAELLELGAEAGGAEVGDGSRLGKGGMRSKILAAEMDFIRVDFYATKDRMYFGEFTITPNNGVLRYDPAEFDLQLGKLWNLKCPR